jgi:hypothetical protein
MVKTKFKIDIIWIRLIIFKILYYARLYGRWYSVDLRADMNHLHVKRIHLVFRLYSYRGCVKKYFRMRSLPYQTKKYQVPSYLWEGKLKWNNEKYILRKWQFWVWKVIEFYLAMLVSSCPLFLTSLLSRLQHFCAFSLLVCTVTGVQKLPSFLTIGILDCSLILFFSLI